MAEAGAPGPLTRLTDDAAEAGARERAMTSSVLAAASSVGIDAETALLRAALAVAMAPRRAGLDDDHHPAYLHPGRTVLVLLRDTAAVTPLALQVGAVTESEDGFLRAEPAAVEAALGPDIEQARARIPAPGSEDLVERLLDLPADLAVAAVAERLDQLRHLHLRSDLTERWRVRHQEVRGAWLPFAERVDATLARRLAHFERAFGRRLERTGGAG